MNIFANGRMRSFSLLFTDIIFLMISILSAFALYKHFGAKYEMEIIFQTWPVLILLIIFNLSGRLYCGNLFYPGLVIHPVEELRRLTLSCAGSFLLFFAILGFARTNTLFSRVALLTSMLLAMGLLPFGRIVLRYLLWKFRLGQIPSIIAGDAEQAAEIINRMRDDNYCILEITGSCCGGKIADDIPDISKDELLKNSAGGKSSYLIYCSGKENKNDDLEDLLPKFLHILVVNNTNKFPVLWSYPVSFYRYFSFEISNRLLRRSVVLQKRLLEVFLSTVGLLLAFIPGIFLALIIKLSSRGPVFYKAKRLGKNGKTIYVLKFRTMNPDADEKLEQLLAENPDMKAEWEKNFKLDNDPRITRIGHFLRKTSLDELPQFWNVLKGEMSLIGPRPIVEKEVKYYGKDYPAFASVKPGITGLWQVSGRSDIDYDERVALDVFYVNNWSLWMDYYIFWATFNAVLFRRGAK